MKNTYIILGVLLFTNLSFAQSHVGNGGDVVVCRNDKNEITSIELLDFYEARDLRQITYDLGDATVNVNEKIQSALNRLSRLDPYRAEQYLKSAQSFMEKAHFVQNKELPDISDSGHLIFPAGCKVEQIVISDVRQLFPEDQLWLPKGKSFIVNAALWNSPLFNNDHKAGLILHEVIYEEARKSFDHSSSVYARYLNSYVTSARLSTYNIQEYMGLLAVARFRELNYMGFGLDPGRSNEFYTNGNPRSAYLPEHPSNPWGRYITIFGKKILLKSEEPLNFYETGTVQLATISDDRILFSTPDRKIVNASDIWFLPNGEIEKISHKPGGMFYKEKPIVLPIDLPNTRRINDILEKMIYIYPLRGYSEIYHIHMDSHFVDAYEYDLDQFLLFGEALDTLSESERATVVKRIQYLNIKQSLYGNCSLFSEAPGIETDKSLDEKDSTYYSWNPHYDPIKYLVTIYFDNNNGEEEFVSKEDIVKLFQRIIRGQ